MRYYMREVLHVRGTTCVRYYMCEVLCVRYCMCEVLYV